MGRFDTDNSGRIDWGNGEFLMVIASIAVTSVDNIDDFVFSAAFRTFDQDADGLITPLEMHIVTRLFLQMETAEQDQFVEERSRRWTLTWTARLTSRSLCSSSGGLGQKIS